MVAKIAKTCLIYIKRLIGNDTFFNCKADRKAPSAPNQSRSDHPDYGKSWTHLGSSISLCRSENSR